jgi:hypothetical protein
MSIPKHIHHPNLPRLYPNSYLHPLSTHNYALLNSLTPLAPAHCAALLSLYISKHHTYTLRAYTSIT